MASTSGIHRGGAVEQLKNNLPHHRRSALNRERPRPAMLRCMSEVSNTRLHRLRVSVPARSGDVGTLPTKSATVGRRKPAAAEERGRIAAENLEEWMRNSVTEIVRNLAEAPLLVHVYSGEEGEMKKLEMETAAEEGDWRKLSERWRKRDSAVPKGVIFVEEIVDGGMVAAATAAEEEEEAGEEDEMEGGDVATKEWGIVVQGKGLKCGPVCYLLKTSRVGSGVGPCCTHFCLMRVRSFMETPKSQLKNCWLLQAQTQYSDGGFWN